RDLREARGAAGEVGREPRAPRLRAARLQADAAHRLRPRGRGALPRPDRGARRPAPREAPPEAGRRQARPSLGSRLLPRVLAPPWNRSRRVADRVGAESLREAPPEPREALRHHGPAG